jgi:hypothetical protein
MQVSGAPIVRDGNSVSQITWPVALSYARNFLPHAHGACGVPMMASLPSTMNNRSL